MRQARVGASARADIRSLLRTSARTFGARARRHYKALLDRAIVLLRENPTRPGVQQRGGLPARLRGTAPKQPRHFILFRFDDERLYVLRVLHESMDIEHRAIEDEPET